jgi:hypothetical protein
LEITVVGSNSLAAQRTQLPEKIVAGRLIATLSQDWFDDASGYRICVICAGSEDVFDGLEATLLFRGVFFFKVFEGVHAKNVTELQCCRQANDRTSGWEMALRATEKRECRFYEST